MSRAPAGLRAIASASSNVNSTSGSIAPAAAAATGLVGISDVSQLAKSTAGAAEVSDAAASAVPGGSSGRAVAIRESNEKVPMPSGSASMVAPASMAMNTAIVRLPIRPIVDTSDAEATPVISSDTTNGITVIRIAFTQSVPRSATASAAPISVALCDAPISRPPARPAPTPTSTHLPSFTNAPTS